MQHDWMQWIPCRLVKFILIEWSGFHAVGLNAVDSMQPGKMHPDWMQWIAWSVIECRVFHSLWCNGSQLCAVESMQRGQMHLDWCSGFYTAWPKHPDLMPWIPCSVIECRVFHAAWRNGTLLNAVDVMQHDWMKWIPAAWLNAVDFLQLGPKHPDLMQWIFCSMSQYIPIECSGFHAASLNAVDSMLVIECSVIHAAW